MAANMQKIKLLKVYELLRKETDEAHPMRDILFSLRFNPFRANAFLIRIRP